MTGVVLAERAPAVRAAVPVLELEEWRERYGLVAGITSAESGFSLSLPPGPASVVHPSWQAFQEAFADRFPAIICSRQVHGTAVQWHAGVGRGWHLLDGLDGHATGESGVLLTIGVADCIPVYLVAPDSGAVALLHAGWRGAAAGVLEQGVACLATNARTDISTIVIHCGIGVCGMCYEVGSEVAGHFVTPPPTGKSHLDLRSVLVERARARGIRTISVSPWCTVHDGGRFHSHRGSGGRAGRMLAYLGRPST